MKYVLIIFIITISFPVRLFSQSNSSVQLIIKDSADCKILINPSVKDIKTEKAYKPNKSGTVNIDINAFPVIICVSHVGYASDTVYINNADKPVEVKLSPLATNLPPVEIRLPKPTKLIRDIPVYISDYEIKGDSIYFIGYIHKQTGNAFLVIASLNGDTLLSAEVKNPERLYKDCFGNIHLVCRKEAYQVFADESGIHLLYPVSKDEFTEAFAQLETYDEKKIYIKKFTYWDQILNYYAYQTDEKNLIPIVSITNEQNRRMMSDLPRLASGSTFTEADMRFEKLCFYKPIYAPLFAQRDSIVIFNFQDSVIEMYKYPETEPFKVRLSKAVYKDFKERVFRDPSTGKYYVYYVSKGVCKLKELDIYSGKTGRTITIPNFAYIQKLTIQNNKLYFLYTERSNNEEFKKIYSMTF